jgi:hypothetical protein
MVEKTSWAGFWWVANAAESSGKAGVNRLRRSGRDNQANIQGNKSP